MRRVRYGRAKRTQAGGSRVVLRSCTAAQTWQRREEGDGLPPGVARAAQKAQPFLLGATFPNPTTGHGQRAHAKWPISHGQDSCDVFPKCSSWLHEMCAQISREHPAVPALAHARICTLLGLCPWECVHGRAGSFPASSEAPYITIRQPRPSGQRSSPFLYHWCASVCLVMKHCQVPRLANVTQFW